MKPIPFLRMKENEIYTIKLKKRVTICNPFHEYFIYYFRNEDKQSCMYEYRF
jgi:hypothetical protein